MRSTKPVLTRDTLL